MKNTEKDKIVGWIREGKKFKECKELADAEGIKTDFHNSFYKWQQEVNPTEKVNAALESSGERRQDREDKKKKEKRKIAWTTKKQQDADNSNLAKLINKGIFASTFPFCKNKALKEENVQEINLGGAVVANVLYFFPNVNLDHPAIVLTTRVILFYLRFKAICSAITQKIDELKAKVVGGDSGIKPEWSEQK